MAVFGIPALHEDDAVRAVRAAGELRRELEGLNRDLARDWGVTLAMRTGVNTGEVVAGNGSSGQRFATGDAVNVAKRFEEAAPPARSCSVTRPGGSSGTRSRSSRSTTSS
jgi:class 3 adenylate cyclase